jgi:hypothetical protein
VRSVFGDMGHFAGFEEALFAFDPLFGFARDDVDDFFAGGVGVELVGAVRREGGADQDEFFGADDFRVGHRFNVAPREVGVLDVFGGDEVGRHDDNRIEVQNQRLATQMRDCWFDCWPQTCVWLSMRRTVDLDAELEAKLSQAASAAKQDAAIVLIEALRVGLPSLSGNVQAAPAAEGFFADAYNTDDPERVALESAMANVVQRPER